MNNSLHNAKKVGICAALFISSPFLILICFHAGLNFAAAAEAPKKPADLVPSITEIQNKTFEAGLQIGYAMGISGASVEDMEMVADAFRKNDLERVRKWKDYRKAPR